jgi:spermidine synthase
MKLNNYYVLGGTASVGDERMGAHIPLLLHPAPRNAAFLGLGTGITASGALFHPVQNITAIEMVPDVAAAARRYFADANAGLLDQSRTRLVLDDARNYLRGSVDKFDVIVGDLVVPWREGEGSLFTIEHFTAARQRLAPGGIFCVWLPFFQLSPREVEILARTFLTVFPQAMIWRGDFSPIEPAVALIGSVEPHKLDASALARRLTEMRPDPSNPQLREPAALWMQFVGLLRMEDLSSSDALINSENRPIIELLGPTMVAADGTKTLFTGRSLLQWESKLLSNPTTSASLQPPEKSAASAGMLLYEFTTLTSENRPSEAAAIQSKLQTILSPELFRAIFP